MFTNILLFFFVDSGLEPWKWMQISVSRGKRADSLFFLMRMFTNILHFFS